MSETHSIRLNIDASAAKTGATQYAAAITKITKATESYQAALAAIGKNKATGDFSKIATAIGKLGSANISRSLAKNLIELSVALSGFRGPSKAASRNAQSLFTMLNAVQVRPAMTNQIAALSAAMSTFKGPSRTSVANISALFTSLNSMNIDRGKIASIAGLTSAFAGFRGPSKSAAANINTLVDALNRLKVPANIGKLTAPLQALASVSASTARAVRQLAATQAGAQSGFRNTGQAAMGLTGNMRGLENAMSLSYQAGSQLRVLFGSLTFAEFTRGVYDATLAVEKFNTIIGITASTQKEFQSQIAFAEGTADKFGVSLSGVYEEYGKFTTAAQMAGQSAENTQAIFASMSGAMRVMGTDAQGQGRVFKALTQIFSKGGVYAEEIRQQIGEQFPAAFALLEQSIEEFTGKDINLNKMLELGQIDDSAMLLFANKVREVMGPQLAKALDRADAKVGRLANSWFRFQAMVGKAGVMDAIGDVAQQLTDALESPAFQSNAQAVAEGIANGLRAMGNAAVWAMDHVRELGAVLLGIMSSSMVANIARVGSTIGSIVLGIGRGAGPLKMFGTLFAGLPMLIGAAAGALSYYWNETVTIGEETASVGTIVNQVFEDIKSVINSAFASVSNFSWDTFANSFINASNTMDGVFNITMNSVVKSSDGAANQTKDIWDRAFDYIASAALRFYGKLGASGQKVLTSLWSNVKMAGASLNPFDDRSELQIMYDYVAEQKKAFEEIDANYAEFVGNVDKKFDIAGNNQYFADLAAQTKKEAEEYVKNAREAGAIRDAQTKAEEEARERAQKKRAADMAKDAMGPAANTEGLDPFRNMNENTKSKDSVGKRAKAATQALKDYRAEISDLNQMLQAGTITLDQFNNGLEYQARKLQESADPYAAMVRGMEDEIKLSGVASKAREIEISHREKINELSEKGVQVTQEMSDKIRNLIEAQRKMNNQPLRDWVDGIEDIGEATDKVAINAMEGLSDQIAEMVVTGKADFASLAQSILKEFIKVGINQMYKKLFGDMLGGTDAEKAKQQDIGQQTQYRDEAQKVIIGDAAKDWTLKGSAGAAGAENSNWADQQARTQALEGLTSSSNTLRGSLDVFAQTVDGANVKITPLNTNLDTMTTGAVNATTALNNLAAAANAQNGGVPIKTGEGTNAIPSTGGAGTTQGSAGSLPKGSGFAQKAYEQALSSGLPDAQARLVAAQATLESGHGKSGLATSANNYFGVKAGKSWSGDTTTMRTREETSAGSSYYENAAFRKYASPEDSFKDHNSLLQRRYPQAANASTFDEAVAGLKAGKQGGYATDTNYASKLKSIESGLVTPRSGTQQAIPVAIDKVGSTGITNGNVFSKLMYSNQDATRSMKVDPALETKIQEAVGNVYGKDYTAEIYSGGQGHKGSGLPRTGTTRHDGGEAADIYVRDPQGNKVQGDGLAPLGQYWQAKGYGGTGMEMRGGGVHLDQHTERARSWNYANEGGQFTGAQAAGLQAGQQGIMPTLAGQQGGIDPAATAGIQQMNDQLKTLGSTAQQTAQQTQQYATQEQQSAQQNMMTAQQKMVVDQQSGVAMMSAGSAAGQSTQQFTQAGQAIQQAGQQAGQGAQAAQSGLGQLGSIIGMIPGLGQYGGLASSILGLFKEGGMSNKPVQTASVPHFAEGTANTSGGMPAMLHPNEAVIPLSRGRKVPVELDSPKETDTNSEFSRSRSGGSPNITMILNGVKDGDTFKRSKRQVETLYSSALRKQAERDT